jgi:predicted metal-dependent hydrolase
MGDVLYVPSRGYSLRLRVKPGGVVIVSVPRGMPQVAAQAFVYAHASWIEKAKARMEKVMQLPPLPRAARAYAAIQRSLLEDMTARVRRIETQLGVTHTRIVIRRAKTRWGSCSKRGTISFSAYLTFFPDEVRDYVAVHEVCHLVEHNHSRAFWDLVSSLCPEYKVHKETLRRCRI